MPLKTIVLVALLPLTVFSSMNHAAENPLTYDRINLSASAQGKAAKMLTGLVEAVSAMCAIISRFPD